MKTHIFFFSGQTTKRRGVNPLNQWEKTLFLSVEKMTKPAWTTKLKGGGSPNLSGPTTKKKFFYVCNLSWKFLTFPKMIKGSFLNSFWVQKKYLAAWGLPDGPWVDKKSKFYKKNIIVFHRGNELKFRFVRGKKVKILSKEVNAKKKILIPSRLKL